MSRFWPLVACKLFLFHRESKLALSTGLRGAESRDHLFSEALNRNVFTAVLRILEAQSSDTLSH